MREKFGKFCVFFAALACLFGGCGKVPTASVGQHRVVTQVDIVCLDDTRQMWRQYTNPEKMEKILNYLRLLKRQSLTSRNPQAAPGSYHITLTLSDGSRIRCHQSGDRVLVKEDGTWQKIDSKSALGINELLENMPSDAL